MRITAIVAVVLLVVVVMGGAWTQRTEAAQLREVIPTCQSLPVQMLRVACKTAVVFCDAVEAAPAVVRIVEVGNALAMDLVDDIAVQLDRFEDWLDAEIVERFG